MPEKNCNALLIFCVGKHCYLVNSKHTHRGKKPMIKTMKDF